MSMRHDRSTEGVHDYTYLNHFLKKGKKDDFLVDGGAINIGTWFLCVIEICNQQQECKL